MPVVRIPVIPEKLAQALDELERCIENWRKSSTDRIPLTRASALHAATEVVAIYRRQKGPRK